MPKNSKRPSKHPDDFMVVSVAIQFQAKPNPDAKDPQPLELVEIENTYSAANAAEYLEEVIGAIRDRRLYGFMAQEAAEGPVGSGEWIAMTTEDLFAAMREGSNQTASSPESGDEN